MQMVWQVLHGERHGEGLMLVCKRQSVCVYVCMHVYVYVYVCIVCM